jgi:hypothetical protein
MHFSTSFATTAFLALLLPNLAVALKAVPSAQCSSVCGNISATTQEEIVCNDFDLSNKDQGKVFQACIKCQMNSTAVDPGTGETDLHWMICKFILVEFISLVSGDEITLD